MTAVLTTFSREASLNTFTVQEMRALSNRDFNGVSWQTAARKVAAAKGGVLVLKADGSLVVFTKLMFGADAGKIRQRTYLPGKWDWEK